MIKKRFSHYLITRFNVPNSEWRKSIEEGGTTWSEWMEERMELFKSYCLPSVKNQSEENFTWLICIDPNTKKKYRSFLESINLNKKKCEIVEVSSYGILADKLGNFIKNDLNCSKEYVITSRLDNDDAIERRFIGHIQNEFNRQKFQPLIFPHGYQLVLVEDDKYMKKVKLPKGPFISLIERTESEVSTVLSKPHTKWNFKKVKSLTKYRPWLQLVHGKNIANGEVIGRTITNLDTKERFGFEKDVSIGMYKYIRKLSKDVEMNMRKKIFEKRKKWDKV